MLLRGQGEEQGDAARHQHAPGPVLAPHPAMVPGSGDRQREQQVSGHKGCHERQRAESQSQRLQAVGRHGQPDPGQPQPPPGQLRKQADRRPGGLLTGLTVLECHAHAECAGCAQGRQDRDQDRARLARHRSLVFRWRSAGCSRSLGIGA